MGEINKVVACKVKPYELVERKNKGIRRKLILLKRRVTTVVVSETVVQKITSEIISKFLI